MKTLTALLLAASAGLALSSSATADWFHDRGDYFINEAPAGSDKTTESAPPSVDPFLGRGDYFVDVAPAGSNKPLEYAPAEQEGFIQRSDFVDELHGPWVGTDGAN